MRESDIQDKVNELIMVRNIIQRKLVMVTSIVEENTQNFVIITEIICILKIFLLQLSILQIIFFINDYKLQQIISKLKSCFTFI